MITFWWRSGSRIRIQIRIRIATLVRRILAEVCTVKMLLVMYFCDNWRLPSEIWSKTSIRVQEELMNQYWFLGDRL